MYRTPDPLHRGPQRPDRFGGPCPLSTGLVHHPSKLHDVLSRAGAPSNGMIDDRSDRRMGKGGWRVPLGGHAATNRGRPKEAAKSERLGSGMLEKEEALISARKISWCRTELGQENETWSL